jgi:hypothetical protein
VSLAAPGTLGRACSLYQVRAESDQCALRARNRGYGSVGVGRERTMNRSRETGSSSTMITNEYDPSAGKRRLLKVNDLTTPKSVAGEAWGCGGSFTCWERG